MTDTQYDYIKENLPEFAEEIERLADAINRVDHDTHLNLMGQIWGIVWTAKTYKICRDADAFALMAIRKAKEEQEK